MMLHQLVEYGQRRGIDAEAGFSHKIARWLLIFDQMGRFVRVMCLDPGERGAPKGRPLVKAPHLQFSGKTPMRQFLVDAAQHMLLLGNEDAPADARVKHEYCLMLLHEAGAVIPELNAIAAALRDPQTLARIRDELASHPAKAKPQDNVTFAVGDTSGAIRLIAEEKAWHNWWRSYFPSLFNKPGAVPKAASTAAGGVRCLVSGELVQAARIHPKIKGLGDVGGNTETTLVGFNLPAFESYGLSQSNNAPISEPLAAAYAGSLNELLRENSRRLAGAKVVYWYIGEKEVAREADPLARFFDGVDIGGEPNEPTDPQRDDPRLAARAEHDAGSLLDSIRSGQRRDLLGYRYCAMTVSGNSGRVVVRDWMEGQFEELAKNIDQWFDDLAIIDRYGRGRARPPKFMAVLGSLVRDLSELPPPLIPTMWHAAVECRAIPRSAMAMALARVRTDIIADQPFNHARMGLLRACCVRNRGVSDVFEELNPASKNPAYLCGRVMAILAAIQEKALPGVGAGVVQRYYAAASATPGLVLGRLVRQAQVGHLHKFEPELRHWFDQRLAEVWNAMEAPPPRTLSLEDQTLFALGYYQQKAERRKAIETPPKSDSDTTATA